MSGLGNREIMAKNIKRYMGLTGKTRNQICSDLGFSYSTFSDWINGKSYPRIDRIEMLADYFGIEKSDLIEDTSDRPDNNINFIQIKDIKEDLEQISKETRIFAIREVLR